MKIRIWEKMFPCKHKELYCYKELCESEIHEPGKEPRKILIRMVMFRCKKCKRVVGLFSKGIAHDPDHGVMRDKDEPMRTEDIDAPVDVRKTVLEYQY